MRAGPAACAVAVLACVASAIPAHADSTGPSWTSLYNYGPYVGSGWANCPEPITISVDTRAVAKSQRRKARDAVISAIRLWNRRQVVTFAYGGEIPMNFDFATGVAEPADGVARHRHVYLTAVKVPPSIGHEEVVGLAGPLRIDPSTDIIEEGSAAFRAQYVNGTSQRRLTEVLAHELGHVFGLGHSTSKSDLMYPILDGDPDLGTGDVQGITALLKPCPDTARAGA